ncbi:MAG: undecaprenyl-phosphate glucose phosphotransferase [Candidatus Dactylopiibacterium carminicum]|nr:MAG: undecaprenyl-phosphate glucose phosphotransferase [Candidatus Dactylopiibacterium carminicum]
MLGILERQKFGGLLRSRVTLISAIEMFLDPCVIMSCLLATALWFDEPLGAQYMILALLAFSLSFPGNLSLMDPQRRIVRKGIMSWGLVIGLLFLFGYGSGLDRFYPNNVLWSWAALSLVCVLGARLGIRSWLPRLLADRRRNPAVVVGGNALGQTLARQFANSPHLGVEVLGFFDDRSAERLAAENEHSPELLGRLDSLADYVKHNHIEQVYIALPMASQPRILKLLDDMKDTTASIYFVPDIFVTDLIQGRMETVNGIPVVAVCETPFTGLNGGLKRASDIVLALLILALIWPILLICALCVKLSSPGPIIFRQRRYGLDGREILVYKFRSMTVCEDGSVVTQATRNDQRITRFGALARKTSLDELPQFINVLQGRMSIVGPRPHAVAHNELYRRQVKGYMIRHKVRPGITGWAQVNGCRGETETVDKMEKRIEYDLEYLRNWSLSLDLWIIAKTVGLMLKDSKAY